MAAEQYLDHILNVQNWQVQYLRPVAGNGDCLFLSMEQILTHHGIAGTNHSIRQLAVSQFLAQYHGSPPEQQQKIHKAVSNLYWPEVSRQGVEGGWGMNRVQTRRLVARRKNRDLHRARILQIQQQYNTNWTAAAAVE
jgi:hypothetical protein